MSRRGRYGCHWCYFRNNDLEVVKYHERKNHGYYRDAKWREDYKKKNTSSMYDKKVKSLEPVILKSTAKTLDGDDIEIYHEVKDGILRTFTDVTKFGKRLELKTDRLNDYEIRNLDELEKEYLRKKEDERL